MAELRRAFLPWGDFAPDLGEFGHDRLTRCENVAPAFGNFHPMPKMKLGSGTATNTLCGLHVHRVWTNDDYRLYAGDIHASASGKLYEVSNDGATFTDRTRAAGGGYTSDEWAFTSFGPTIVACNYNDEVQHITAGGANFADGITSTFKPQARYPFVVKGNVFLAHCTIPVSYDTLGTGNNPYLVVWSKTDAPAIYGSPAVDPQHVGAGFQQLYNDLGYITAVHGGEFGLVFQERGVVRIDGPPYTFRIISDNLTTRYPYSVVKIDEDVYFWSRNGPCVLRGGEGPAINLGAGRVARTLVDNFSGFSDLAINREPSPPTGEFGVSAAYSPSLGAIVFSGLRFGITDEWESISVIYSIAEDRFSYWIQPTLASSLLRQRPVQRNGSDQWLPASELIGVGDDDTLVNGYEPVQLATFEFAQTGTPLTYNFRRAYAQLEKDEVTRVLRVRPVHRTGSLTGITMTLTATLDSINDPAAAATQKSSTTQDAHGWLTFDDTVDADFHRIQISYAFDNDAKPNLLEAHGVEVEYVAGGAYSA